MKKLLAVLAFACAAAAEAQNFPSRPVTIVVPYPPGGLIDLVARALQPFLQTELGVSVLAENHSGAGGNLGATGSVAWMFTRQGQIVIDANGRDPDEIGLEAIDMGAGDARVDGKTVDIVTDPARLESLQQGLKKKGYKIDSAEVTMNASQLISLNEATAPSILKLLDALEEHDDVQAVYSNMDVPADVLERISERV